MPTLEEFEEWCKPAAEDQMRVTHWKANEIPAALAEAMATLCSVIAVAERYGYRIDLRQSTQGGALGADIYVRLDDGDIVMHGIDSKKTILEKVTVQ